MAYVLKIETDNAAFQPVPQEEIANILRNAAEKVWQLDVDGSEMPLFDTNGNRVGSHRLEHEREEEEESEGGGEEEDEGAEGDEQD